MNCARQAAAAVRGGKGCVVAPFKPWDASRPEEILLLPTDVKAALKAEKLRAAEAAARADVGMQVKPGQLLLTLDPAELRNSQLALDAEVARLGQDLGLVARGDVEDGVGHGRSGSKAKDGGNSRKERCRQGRSQRGTLKRTIIR